MVSAGEDGAGSREGEVYEAFSVIAGLARRHVSRFSFEWTKKSVAAWPSFVFLCIPSYSSSSFSSSFVSKYPCEDQRSYVVCFSICILLHSSSTSCLPSPIQSYLPSSPFSSNIISPELTPSPPLLPPPFCAGRNAEVIQGSSHEKQEKKAVISPEVV